MKYAVLTDIEGAVGVERFSQTRGNEPFYAVSKRELTNEVNALIAGIFDADQQAVIHVSDAHGPGGLIKEKMDARAVYCRFGEPVRFSDDWPSYAAHLCVGLHAMAGTPNAPLAHSFSSKQIVYKKLNGLFVGEFGMHAAKAGYFNVPTILVTGDDKVTSEARTLVEGIYTVVTKWGESAEKAHHLTSEEACRQIRQATAQACGNIQRIKPLHFDPPYASEVRYIQPHEKPKDLHPDVRVDQIDAYTIIYRADDLALLPN